MVKNLVKKIRKRTGEIDEFDDSRITAAIEKAMRVVGEHDSKEAKKLTGVIVDEINRRLENFNQNIPNVEQVQDIVEEILSKSKFQRTAKAYMLYRRGRTHARELKAFFGIKDDLKFDVNAIRVLQERYLLKDEKGRIIETPTEMFKRVAKVIASVEEKEKEKWEKRFFEMMKNLEFLPNSPTLMNAGTSLGQLSACFVLPVEDSLESIFDTLKDMALIQQCVAPNTLIMTDNGLIKIKDANEKMLIATEEGSFNIEKKHNIGEKPIYEVKTEHGYAIKATAEHRLLLMNKEGKLQWKKISNIKNGDWVVLSSSKWMGSKTILPKFEWQRKPKRENRTAFKPTFYELPTEMTPELAEFIGLFVGDGSWHRDGLRFTVGKKQKDLIEHITKLSNWLFKRHITICKKNKKGAYEVAILSKQIKEWLKFIGVKKDSANEVLIPDIIMQSPEEVVRAFIRGLFTTDGCIRESGHITYSTASKEMAETLQVLLLHIGIPTRLYVDNKTLNNKKFKLYLLSICSKQGFIEFKQKIGFSSRFKQNRLANVNEKDIFTRGEAIPNQNIIIKKLFNELPDNKKREIKPLLQDIMWRQNNVRELTSQKISQIEQLCELPKNLKALLNMQLFFTKVQSITPAGNSEVYDLTVSFKHSYIANGFVSHNSGGGTGFSFSHLRPRGDIVRSTKGIASGPVSFIEIYDAATEVIKQGGKRRGANMGILHISHPDIVEFIKSKQKEKHLSNFNISVGVDDKFMHAVEKNQDYELIDPHNGKITRKINARALFNLICESAWKTGDPGMIFIDEINRKNQVPGVGRIEATNPCGEVPLLNYESCNLGSINLTKFVSNGKIDYEKLKMSVRDAVRFLDNVIDANNYPFIELERMALGNRRIGLGVMGFADMLALLDIPYDSEKAIEIAEKLMSFITKEAHIASELLGKEKGNFPNFKKSIWDGKVEHMRNCACTTIAPTGTLSIIAGCSSGIEPLFALSYMREVLSGKHLFETNKIFLNRILKEGLYSEKLVEKIAKEGNLANINLPEKIKRIFKTALEISPEQHIKIQAAFQKHTDNAVSKTINLRNDASVEDVKKAYMLAYKLKCKGITIYRYGSKPEQVLYLGKGKEYSKASDEYAYGTCIGKVCAL